MNNLTAVQRADKTGKVVTRHVRTDPKQLSQRPALPGPALAPSSPAKPAQSHFKPRPKQLEKKTRAYVATFLNVDDELCDAATRAELWDTQCNYVFNAPAVETYDVLSVVEKTGSAVIMLTEGVRSAEEAQQYLIDHGAEHLIIDRSAMTQEALEKNLDVDDFIVRAHHTNRWGNKIDAALFFNSSLNRNANGLVMDEIVTGAISYDDIKKLGTTKLKPNERLYRLRNLLKSVKRGENTIEKLQGFLDRAIDEKLTSAEFAHAVLMVEARGLDLADKVTKIGYLSEGYDATHFPHTTAAKLGETKMDRAVYLALLTSLTDDRLRYGDDREYFESGIPVEIAAKAVNRGGGLLQAQAMHEAGINENLAEGWL
jgi:hypothetical protein